MGGATVAIVFTNTGPQPCSMIGWSLITTPGLSTTVRYQTTAGAGFEVGVTRVNLQPGASAAATLDLFNAPGNAYGGCDKPGSWQV